MKLNISGTCLGVACFIEIEARELITSKTCSYLPNAIPFPCNSATLASTLYLLYLHRCGPRYHRGKGTFMGSSSISNATDVFSLVNLQNHHKLQIKRRVPTIRQQTAPMANKSDKKVKTGTHRAVSMEDVLPESETLPASPFNCEATTKKGNTKYSKPEPASAPLIHKERRFSFCVRPSSESYICFSSWFYPSSSRIWSGFQQFKKK